MKCKISKEAEKDLEKILALHFRNLVVRTSGLLLRFIDGRNRISS